MELRVSAPTASASLNSLIMAFARASRKSSRDLRSSTLWSTHSRVFRY